MKLFNEEVLNSPVEQWMTSSPLTVRKKDKLESARHLMNVHKIHHLPVIDENRSPCGILSAYDLALVMDWKTSLEIGEFKEINKKILGSILVEDVMRKPAILNTQSKLAECLELFKSNEFHAILIEDNQTLEGIITTHDILFKFYN